MTTEHALLQAIKADPEDDNLRLILADWLDDNGQSERAEFVRLQVQDKHLPKGNQRERELLAAHAADWLGPFAHHPVITRAGFFRGLCYLFVNASRQSQGSLLADCADAREQLWWIDALLVEKLAGRINVLVNSPVLLFLSELRLESNGIVAEGAATLAGSARLAELTSLGLRDNPIGDAGAAALARSPHLRNLTSLNLCGCNIGDPGAAALASSVSLNKLASLRLDANPVTAEGAVALRRHFGDRVRL